MQAKAADIPLPSRELVVLILGQILAPSSSLINRKRACKLFLIAQLGNSVGGLEAMHPTHFHYGLTDGVGVSVRVRRHGQWLIRQDHTAQHTGLIILMRSN